MIDMIKKVCKSLKFTNYGKKIYENLMKNYGEYLNNLKTHKNSVRSTKKSNTKKNLSNLHAGNIHINIKESFTNENEKKYNGQKPTKNGNYHSNLEENKLTSLNKSNSIKEEKLSIIKKYESNTNVVNIEDHPDVTENKTINYWNHNRGQMQNMKYNKIIDSNFTSELDKSFSYGRPSNSSVL